MAAEWDDTCLDISISDYSVDTVLQLQAVCRGWLVRRKLKDAQREFQQIVQDVDGPSVRVEWTESALPLPVVYRATKKTRVWKQQQDEKHTCGQNADSKPGTKAECQKCAEKTSVCTRTEGASAKPNSQSDQQVQTEFPQTNSLPNKAEEDTKQDPVSSDNEQPVKESTDQKLNNLQFHGLKNEVCAGRESGTAHTDLKLVAKKSRDEHQTDTASVITYESERLKLNVDVSTSTDTAASHISTQPSLLHVVLSSDTALEPSGVRKVDSFHGDQTSVWDSSSSVLQEHETAYRWQQGGQPQPDGDASSSRATKAACLETGADMTVAALRSLSTEELLRQRQNVALELLWVQQAIISRKKYLKLKMQMEAAT